MGEPNLLLAPGATEPRYVSVKTTIKYNFSKAEVPLSSTLYSDMIRVYF